MQDLIQRQGIRQGWLRHKLMPWFIAFFYYHVSWLLFLVKPERSYMLNAEFEDHAEHEYMAFVAEHPELEHVPDPGAYAAEYGHQRSIADLFRQIAHDERMHKVDGLAKAADPHVR